MIEDALYYWLLLAESVAAAVLWSDAAIDSGTGEPWVGAHWRPVIVMHRRPLEQ